MIFVLLTFLMLFAVSPAQAFEPREGEEIVIKQGEVVEDDLYAAANIIRVEGTIEGDLLAAGNLVVLGETGIVEGDLWAAAQGVVVNGTVNDDVRIAGAVLTVGSSATISGDLLAFGYSIQTSPDSAVDSDMLAFGGVVSLDGTIGRDLRAGAGGLVLNGTVDGDVDAEVGGEGDTGFYSPMFFNQVPGMPAPVQVRGGLTVGPDAQIKGSLTYTSPQEASLAEGVVAGQTTHIAPPPEPVASPEPAPPTMLERTLWWGLGLLRDLVTLLLVGLILAYFLPGLLRKGAQMLKDKPVPSFLWGIGAYIGFFALLVVIFMAMVIFAVIFGVVRLGDLAWTVVGAGVVSLAGLSFSFSVAASYLAKILIGYLFGLLIFNQLKPDLAENRFWPALVGIVIFVILAAIPIAGGIFSFFAVLFGLGALLLLLRDWFDGRKKTPIEPAPEPA
jgi:cytoskeletal protein CcmA (bactofilin family)